MQVSFGWKYGIASTWIGIGNAVIGSLLAWVVLGRRTKIMTQHLGSKTMPDFFGQRYSSKPLKNRSVGDCLCISDPIHCICI